MFFDVPIAVSLPAGALGLPSIIKSPLLACWRCAAAFNRRGSRYIEGLLIFV
jgi:hypothetical protein